MKRVLAVAACVWLPCSLAAQTDEPFGLPLSGDAAEAFLRSARVVKKKALAVGITHSDQYTLSDGTRTARAVWKTIDESKPGVTNFQGGGFVVDFADSWKHEVASYELDKLVGTGLVPPTVERTFDRTTRIAPALGREGDDRGRPQAEEASHLPTSRPGTARCTACGCCTSSRSTSTPRTSATS